MKILNLYMLVLLLGSGVVCAADQINVTFKNDTSYGNDEFVLTANIMRPGSSVVLFSKQFSGTDFFKKDFSLLRDWQQAKELLELTNVPLAITMNVLFEMKQISPFEGRTEADLYFKDPTAAQKCKKWVKAPRVGIFAGIYDRFDCVEPNGSQLFTIVYDPKKNQLYMYKLHIVDGKDGLQLQEVDALKK